jgi:hypothetical protein
MFHYLTLKESETHAGISSNVKCFLLCFGMKNFVENVLECLGLSYIIRIGNVADYKRWAKT